MACPSKFQQLSDAKNHFFLNHQEAKPVDSITEDIGNININKSRPNSDTDSDSGNEKDFLNQEHSSNQEDSGTEKDSMDQEGSGNGNITEDIGNININKFRPNSDTDSDINCSY